ncbi:ABC transporter permease [Ilumatobacter sp.]|uniref:ABC transporter permease n=1 Tax=Ilumatobacter sp. TaxID=1967498 RepID=UPI003B518BF7
MGATSLIARRSIRSRLGRTIVIALAVTASVSFVVGSFVLADSLRATFSNLFDELAENVDLEVRSAEAFDTGAQGAQRDPIDPAIAQRIAAIEGVAGVEPTVTRYAQVLDSDGEAHAPQGGPTLGVSWEPDAGLQAISVRDGDAPTGPDQVALDAATADAIDVAVGDEVAYVTDNGRFTATVAGTIGLGDTDGFAGASVLVTDLDTALARFTVDGRVDAIDIGLEPGADSGRLRERIEAELPPRTEVITGERLAEEAADGLDTFVSAFGTGLLIFAFVTGFVAAFMINNIFQITIGQRLRELALLRAVGASGRQVRRMIVLEALALGVVATVVGSVAGLGVARGIVALFNAAGAGFPPTGTVVQPRTLLVAAVVGIGITVASVFVPARRAASIPPVAAMRPELGYGSLSAGRVVGGLVALALGVAALGVGLFVRPGSTTAWGALAGVGAVVIFLGVARVSSVIAGPVARAIGWPVEKVLKVPGKLARDNVVRAPRRTSSSASALMIGVALVSAAAVFAASLRASFVATLETTIQADYVIDDPSFQGLSPIVAETLAEVPELGAVTPVRAVQGEVDGVRKDFGAVDGDAFALLVDPGVEEGGIADLGPDEVLVQADPARDLGLEVGDAIDVTWQNGREGSLTVAAIYEDSTFGNWLIGLDTLERVSDAPVRDFFILAQLAEGVSAQDGDVAVDAAMEPFPQANVQTNAEFRESQEAQIDQLLVVITILLAMAILLAVFGVAVTLALGVFERTREIGLLRAVGMNRRQLRRSVRWEAVIVATFGAIVGIVVGTLLGVVLSSAVPDSVISRLAFSPLIIVAILVGAVVAGLAAAVYPAYQAADMDVLDAIATE